MMQRRRNAARLFDPSVLKKHPESYVYGAEKVSDSENDPEEEDEQGMTDEDFLQHQKDREQAAAQAGFLRTGPFKPVDMAQLYHYDTMAIFGIEDIDIAFKMRRTTREIHKYRKLLPKQPPRTTRCANSLTYQGFSRRLWLATHDDTDPGIKPYFQFHPYRVDLENVPGIVPKKLHELDSDSNDNENENENEDDDDDANEDDDDDDANEDDDNENEDDDDANKNENENENENEDDDDEEVQISDTPFSK
jgi:hypothetical protein